MLKYNRFKHTVRVKKNPPEDLWQYFQNDFSTKFYMPIMSSYLC